MESLLAFYPQLSLVRDALKGSGARVFLVGGALRDYYLTVEGLILILPLIMGHCLIPSAGPPA